MHPFGSSIKSTSIVASLGIVYRKTKFSSPCFKNFSDLYFTVNRLDVITYIQCIRLIEVGVEKIPLKSVFCLTFEPRSENRSLAIFPKSTISLVQLSIPDWITYRRYSDVSSNMRPARYIYYMPSFDSSDPFTNNNGGDN